MTLSVATKRVWAVVLREGESESDAVSRFLRKRDGRS